MQFTEHVAVVDGVPAEGTHGLPLDPIIKVYPTFILCLYLYASAPFFFPLMADDVDMR
jgi:hypothetical protein